MLKELIWDHLNYIDKYIEEWSIIVYRWFPNNFIMDIAKKYSYVSNWEKFDIDWNIKLKYIDSNKQDLIKNVLYKELETRVLLYEELLLIDREINIGTLLDRDIYIFDNTILRYFPNQSDQLSNNIEKLIEDDKDIEEGDDG